MGNNYNKNDWIKGIIIGCLIAIIPAYVVKSIESNLEEAKERKRLAVVLLMEVSLNGATLISMQNSIDAIFKYAREEGHLGNLDMTEEKNWQKTVYKAIYDKLGIFDFTTIVSIINFYNSIDNLKFNFDINVRNNKEALIAAEEQVRRTIKDTISKRGIVQNELQKIMGNKVKIDYN